MKVFVYGTLKRGGRLFLEPHARNIHPAKIRGKLYKHGSCNFPFADIDEEGWIHGEVHEYDQLLVLEGIDRIEAMYERRTTTTSDGEEVYVYHFNGIDETFTHLPEGIWNLSGGN